MTSADNPALRETTHRWLGLDVEHDTCCECGWSCQNGDGNPHACARDHAAHVAAFRETRQKAIDPRRWALREELMDTLGKIDARYMRGPNGKEIGGAHFVTRDSVALMIDRIVLVPETRPEAQPPSQRERKEANGEDARTTRFIAQASAAEQPTPQDEDDIFACRVCDDPNGDGERTVLHTECLDALKSRIAEARNEALEEAAKIIDETMKNLHIEMQKEPVYVQWARNGGAGTAIRALKSGAGRS